MASTLKSINKTDCLERRLKPRIYDDFVAKVRGIDASQERFVEHTVVENLSASGLYMKLPRRVELEARILIILHLLFPSVEPQIELLVAFRGGAREKWVSSAQ